MKAALLLALAPFAFASPAAAAGMDPSMRGMSMPMPAAKTGAKPTAKAAHPRKPRRRTKHAHPSALVSSDATHGMAAMRGMVTPAGSAGMAGMHHGQPAPGAASGQGMAAMSGMTMPAKGRPESSTPPSATAGGGQGKPGMAGMADMKGMNMSSGPTVPAAEEQVGHEPPPAPITDHAADRVFDPAAMAAARAELRHEHGGEAWSMVMLNLAEYQARTGGYRWEGEASFGGDINRVYLKSEGEGSGRLGVGAAEIQALYSRAFTPYFNLQAGVRQDIGPSPRRTYAAVGFEGLSPYLFEVSGTAFLSSHGELLGRLEGYEDFRITQRWILQPRAELNLAAQSVPETGIGAGLSNLELGLRLRYELKREFAPYVGISYDQKMGRTADFARLRGEGPGGASFVAGIRMWF
ncbi:MAG TPA: copper resistance protein B [Caulobacteraceae bacterium]